MTQEIELSRKQRELRDELIATSAMTVRPAFDNRDLHALHISIAGALARLPSVNRKRADAKAVWSTKRRRMVTVGYIRKEPAVQAQLAALTGLFHRACTSYEPLTFGKAPVFIRALLADQPGRWDSHNKAKDICDIVEAWRVIDDDSRAECWPSKKSDYNCADVRTSQIIVVRFDVVKQLHRSAIEHEIAACRFDELPPFSR